METAAPAKPERLTLQDGAELVVRSVVPEDKELISQGFERLSPESRYRRFFAPLEELSPRDLAYLTEIDHYDHEALAAIEPDSGLLIGVARYVRGAEPHLAEAAVVVADDWHNRGVATRLLERLSGRARAAGITHFVALILSENRDALELFERFAPETPARRSQSGHLELLIELPEAGELDDSTLAGALRGAARGVVTMNPWRVLRERIRRLPGSGAVRRSSGAVRRLGRDNRPDR